MVFISPLRLVTCFFFISYNGVYIFHHFLDEFLIHLLTEKLFSEKSLFAEIFCEKSLFVETFCDEFLTEKTHF